MSAEIKTSDYKIGVLTGKNNQLKALCDFLERKVKKLEALIDRQDRALECMFSDIRHIELGTDMISRLSEDEAKELINCALEMKRQQAEDILNEERK